MISIIVYKTKGSERNKLFIKINYINNLLLITLSKVFYNFQNYILIQSQKYHIVDNINISYFYIN